MVPMWFFPIAIAQRATRWCSSPVRRTQRGHVLADLWARAGLPDGVFNVVHGDKVAVDALLTHPDVASISSSVPPRSPSTSTRTAPRRASAVQALGGAKNHMLVLPDGPPNSPRIRRQRRLRLGGRAVHGDLGAGRGEPVADPELVAEIAGRVDPRVGDGRRADPTWAHW